jgi:hypothetical protein
MLKKVRDWLLLPVFLVLALALPEDEREDLRAEREMIERANGDR